MSELRVDHFLLFLVNTRPELSGTEEFNAPSASLHVCFVHLTSESPC